MAKTKKVKKGDPMERLKDLLAGEGFRVREVYGVAGFLVLANRQAVAQRKDVGLLFADHLSDVEADYKITFDWEGDPVILNERAPRVGITGDDKFYFLAHVMKVAEPKAVVSYAPEVIADSSGKWTGNGLRFATKAEAEAWVLDLSMRWTLVRETRVVESTDPVNR